MISEDISDYNQSLASDYSAICKKLAREISANLPGSENKIWHGHPVWFLEGNPIVGYSVQKPGVRLMFWSGADFEDAKLLPGTGKFKDASIYYNSVEEINQDELTHWLEQSTSIQWDYKNIVKNRGVLERLR